MQSKKAQGSLEYLIIVAAVLAIASVVVLFLSGAFTSTQTTSNLAKCKQQAATCATNLVGTAQDQCSVNTCNSCSTATMTVTHESTVCNTYPDGTTPTVPAYYGDDAVLACTYGMMECIVAK